MRKLVIAAASLAILASPSWGEEPNLVDAAREGRAADALALIEAGADANAAEPNGTTALHWAAHRGEVDVVRALLEAGADADAANDYGATPMSEAAAIGSAGVIEALLAAGVDANVANREGQTPLMAVARTGRIDAAEALLARGASVNAVETWGGQTALMWAAALGQSDMVGLLIEHGADVDARGSVRNWPRRVTSEPREKIMDRGGFTPLLFAAREGCIDCARQLIAGGADIDLASPERVTPLVLALLNFHFDMAAFLIQSGADIDKWDFSGRTPLYVAVDLNTPPVTARPDLPSPDELTAIQIVDMLLDRGADPDIQLKHKPRFRDPNLERGTDVVLSIGATPLLRAAHAADLESMGLLLEHGALVDLPNDYGVTPLMAAAGEGFSVRSTRGQRATEADRIEAARLLLDAGADVNWRTRAMGRVPPPGMDNFLWRSRVVTGLQQYTYAFVPPAGRTALHSAARNGWVDLAAFLIERGADVEAVDGAGATPLDLAYGRYPPVIQIPDAVPLPEMIAFLKLQCPSSNGCERLKPNELGEAGNDP